MDAEGRFLSHAVSAGWVAGGQSRRRRRREVGVGNNEWENREHLAHQERLYYNVTVFGREFHLRLRHNARLVAPGAKMEWHDDSDNIRYSEPLHDECLYVGDITDTPGATAAISNCDGLVSWTTCRTCVSSWLLSSAKMHLWMGWCTLKELCKEKKNSNKICPFLCLAPKFTVCLI